MLDSSAFIAGFDPSSVNEDSYTVPAVKSEIMKNRTARLRFETAVENGKLKVLTPEEDYFNYVGEMARTVGDAHMLSETDLQVLALAIKLENQGLSPIVVTDDYSIQNVAKHLGLEFASLATFGIKTIIRWIRYCPACYKKYTEDYKVEKCEICGTELRRKPVKKGDLYLNSRVCANEHC